MRHRRELFTALRWYFACCMWPLPFIAPYMYLQMLHLHTNDYILRRSPRNHHGTILCTNEFATLRDPSSGTGEPSQCFIDHAYQLVFANVGSPIGLCHVSMSSS